MTELRLSKTSITDNEMAVIGKMGCNLRHLDISDIPRYKKERECESIDHCILDKLAFTEHPSLFS